MSTATVIIVLLILVIAAGAAWIFMQRRKTTQLRGRFGPEYDRAVLQQGSQREAEAELEKRAKRVEKFHIHVLPREDRERFAEAWRADQARFVDDPDGAVVEADRLVTEAMRAKGYPMGEFDQRAGDLSVEHPHVVQHYRLAHEIAIRHRDGQANTEELRKAMVHYRALFEDLLNTKIVESVEEVRR